MLLDVMLRKA